MMKNLKKQWNKDGFLLRPARYEDAENYYQQNFNPLDSEVARLTGSKSVFSRDEVVSFFHQCLESDSHIHFLILDPMEKIIGETVINEIDWELKKANFRIAIFHPEEQGKGIGSWAIEKTRDFAFEQLQLHRLELDVFSFNLRAEKAYKKAGFKREGVLKDAIRDDDTYADDILMAILEDEWRLLYQ